MKLLVWNCRRLGNRPAVQKLVDIVRAQDPMVVFFSETWSNREHMVRINEKLEFDDLFTIPNDGRGGGLALLWKESIKVWVDGFSKYQIDLTMEGGSENAWQLRGFYRELDTNRRTEEWNMLQMLNSKPKLPWCCFGDFNELLKVRDKGWCIEST